MKECNRSRYRRQRSAVVDQRVGGSVGGRVKVAEEDSTAVKGVGGAFLGMDTTANWTKKSVGVHFVV
jgi:hypothetical protein